MILKYETYSFTQHHVIGLKGAVAQYAADKIRTPGLTTSLKGQGQQGIFSFVKDPSLRKFQKVVPPTPAKHYADKNSPKMPSPTLSGRHPTYFSPSRQFLINIFYLISSMKILVSIYRYFSTKPFIMADKY